MPKSSIKDKALIVGAAAAGTVVGNVIGRYGVVAGMAAVAFSGQAKGYEDHALAFGTGLMGASVVKATQPELPMSTTQAMADTKGVLKGFLNGLFVDKVAPSVYPSLGLGCAPNYPQLAW